LEAEIITIGTELLLGEIVDTNSHTLARALRDIGIDLYRTTTVGDNVDRISRAVRESLDRAQVVITTGGLGPTVDDPTRDALAKAVDQPLEIRPELWQDIQDRYARFGSTPSENCRKMAYLPRGAIAIPNPVGTAPAFHVEKGGSLIIALPGVPAELDVLLKGDVLPLLRKRVRHPSLIRTRILRTAGVGESLLDERIADLERLSNPTVGLAAHPGRVDIRITAKGRSEMEIGQQIWKIEATLRQRLGDIIYGTDEETLEGVIGRLLDANGLKLVTVEQGTDGHLRGYLNDAITGQLDRGMVLEAEETIALKEALSEWFHQELADLGLALRLRPGAEKHEVQFALQDRQSAQTWTRTYGGPAANAPAWAVSQCLEALRKHLS
jgi:competence/damage-inducible protein CinA-like protein